MPTTRSIPAPARPRTRARLALAGAATGLAATFLVGPAALAADCTVIAGFRFCNPHTGTTSRTPFQAPATTLPPVPTTVKAPPPPVPTTLPPAPAPVAVAGPDTAAARKLLDIVNAERAGRGLGTLTWRDDVAAIALAHSHRMASAGTIFHNDGFFSSQTKAALGSKLRGENVAMNVTMEATHLALMNSPGHRANLLNPAFNVVGFAVVRNTNGVAYVTQNFIQAGSVPLAARPAAATSPAGGGRPANRPAGKPAAPAAGAPAPEQQPAAQAQAGIAPATDVDTGPVELALPLAPTTPANPAGGAGDEEAPLPVALVASGIALLALNPLLILARRRTGLVRLARLVTRR